MSNAIFAKSVSLFNVINHVGRKSQNKNEACMYYVCEPWYCNAVIYLKTYYPVNIMNYSVPTGKKLRVRMLYVKQIIRSVIVSQFGFNGRKQNNIIKHKGQDHSV